MRVLTLFLLAGLSLLGSPAFAADSSGAIGIVAVVDDQAISSVDLSDRLALTMSMAGIPDTEENRAHLAPQVLRQLVDERLQMEEATRDGIAISDAKLKDGIAIIEKQSGKPPGSLEQFLQDKGLSKLSFYAQVKAQLAWSEIILKKVRPKVRISDQEIAHYAARSAASPAHAKEALIAILQLPVDSPENEANVKKLADKLASSIHSGANFEAVAAQFSTSARGAKASEPFWVELPQLDPVVSAALAQTQPGGITPPLRTAGGYQIVKLLERRESGGANSPAGIAASVPRAEFAYKQILMELKPDAKRKEAEVLLSLAQEVARQPGTCTDKSMSGVGDLSTFDFKVTLARTQSDDVPPKLRELLMGMKVGSVSEPVLTPQGIRIFMLCERMDLPPIEVPQAQRDEAIRRAIFEQKMELEAQKYMRDLRREAFVEMRMR